MPFLQQLKQHLAPLLYCKALYVRDNATEQSSCRKLHRFSVTCHCSSNKRCDAVCWSSAGDIPAGCNLSWGMQALRARPKCKVEPARSSFGLRYLSRAESILRGSAKRKQKDKSLCSRRAYAHTSRSASDNHSATFQSLSSSNKIEQKSFEFS